MINKEKITCTNCNKLIYPIDLKNKDRTTWCECHKVGIPADWRK